MQNPPTSMRFSADEIELLDAWKARLIEQGWSRRTSRTDVVRHLMRNSRPSDNMVGEAAFALRTLHKQIFGDTK